MKEQDIQDRDKAEYKMLMGNVVIREFMNEPTIPIRCQYHTSWDWLMPCVKKWNDLVISKRNEGEPGWTKWQYKTVMLRTEIEPVYKDLIEKLQWHNQQKQENKK